MTTISEVLAGVTEAAEGYRASIPDTWRQGRTAFGGVSAAICVEAALRALKDAPPLRSAQFAFIGPAGGDVRATVNVLRRGRSATFAGVDLFAEDALAVRATLCFGAERPSGARHAALPAPAVPKPADCPPAFATRAPTFLQNFDVRDAGARTAAERLLWLRHRDDAAPETIAALIALADAPPPSALNLATQPGPISTMTWMVDLLATAPLSADGWRLIRNIADTVSDGYSSQGSVMWDSAGAPVLAARQNVAVFF
jgi:acyl-CoA thioesterase